MREGARIDTVTGSPWSRDINVNGKEKRQGEDRRGGNRRFAQRVSTEEGE